MDENIVGPPMTKGSYGNIHEKVGDSYHIIKVMRDPIDHVNLVEVDILTRLSHPNLSQCTKVFISPNETSFIIPKYKETLSSFLKNEGIYTRPNRGDPHVPSKKVAIPNVVSHIQKGKSPNFDFCDDIPQTVTNSLPLFNTCDLYDENPENKLEHADERILDNIPNNRKDFGAKIFHNVSNNGEDFNICDRIHEDIRIIQKDLDIRSDQIDEGTPNIPIVGDGLRIETLHDIPIIPIIRVVRTTQEDPGIEAPCDIPTIQTIQEDPNIEGGRILQNVSHDIPKDQEVEVSHNVSKNQRGYNIEAYHNIPDAQNDNTKIAQTNNRLIDINSTKISIFRDILYGLDYLHRSRYIHLDIHHHNIMLGYNSKWILIDFGLSVYLGDRKDVMIDLEARNAPFAPPELTHSTTGALINQSADIWSLGLILAELFTNDLNIFYKPPERNPLTTAMRVRKILKSLHNLPEHYPVYGMVKSMLSIKSNRRPTTGDLLKIGTFSMSKFPLMSRESIAAPTSSLDIDDWNSLYKVMDDMVDSNTLTNVALLAINLFCRCLPERQKKYTSFESYVELLSCWRISSNVYYDEGSITIREPVEVSDIQNGMSRILNQVLFGRIISQRSWFVTKYMNVSLVIYFKDFYPTTKIFRAREG